MNKSYKLPKRRRGRIDSGADPFWMFVSALLPFSISIPYAMLFFVEAPWIWGIFCGLNGVMTGVVQRGLSSGRLLQYAGWLRKLLGRGERDVRLDQREKNVLSKVSLGLLLLPSLSRVLFAPGEDRWPGQEEYGFEARIFVLGATFVILLLAWWLIRKPGRQQD